MVQGKSRDKVDSLGQSGGEGVATLGVSFEARPGDAAPEPGGGVGERATPLGALLTNRRLSLVLLTLGLAQLGLSAAGWPAWTCPVKASLGIPCPGCGLTTATLLLLRGEFRAALHVHLFAPLVPLGLISVALLALLPSRRRERALESVIGWERRWRLAVWLAWALVVYWGLRLAGWN
jgi:hypothetical protein